MTRGGALLGAALLLSGCVYYNAIYNAERLYEEAELHWSLGRDSLASATYLEVERRAASGYRREPGGPWADDALFLLGRAQLRRGELADARATLEAAARTAEEPELRRRIGVYRGATAYSLGDQAGALAMLNEALRGLESRRDLAEAHYWRGQILLEAGRGEAGWWDLDRAGEGHPTLAVPAALAKVAWAIRLDDLARAREGVRRLLGHSEAAARRDSLQALVLQAGEQWGWESAAALLAGAEGSRWPRGDRGWVVLTRSRLQHLAGDTASARAGARQVARGVGAAAADARLLMADWALAEARDMAALAAVLPVLLPSEDEPRVAAKLEALGDLEELTELGLDEPLAWFAAAEVARERLGASLIARGLFLAFVDADPDSPWSAKALLAALDATPDEGGRAWIRGRLEGRDGSPYVLAARGQPAPGFESLEEELARRLAEMRNR